MSFQTSSSVSLSVILGLLFALLGTTQLIRVYFEFDPATCTIGVKTLFGVTRRFGGAKGGLLYVDGDRIMCVSADGRTRRVPVSRYAARGDQWRAVVAHIEQAPITGPGAV